MKIMNDEVRDFYMMHRFKSSALIESTFYEELEVIFMLCILQIFSTLAA